MEIFYGYGIVKIGGNVAGLPPDGRILIQQNDGVVSIFDQYTEEVLITFDPYDRNSTAIAQGHIWRHEKLTDEQKCFACFWSGYFYRNACGDD